ncbi:MAG TPA: ThiF family adenylyltransferase [Cyclobacteriaceae bacterium]|nr:ThiF family adenylyltransferase [Cyclobacteriaceae bacterium]
MGDFSPEESIRYSRHFVLPGFGKTGQERLKAGRVLVVGAGGLGAPVLFYLAAAGVGKIGIADNDSVTLSNLQRQILYNTSDVGKRKATTAAGRLRNLNPDIYTVAIETRIGTGNIFDIIKDYDIIVDATDNFPTRYLLNDAAVLAGKTLIYGSIFRYEGQVAVFNHNGGPNYRDLYPLPPAPGTVPDCEQGGVLGVLAGMIGCYQANEAIKLLSGNKDTLAGKLLIVDSLTSETTIITVPDRKARSGIKNLIDYDEFCGLKNNTGKSLFMKEVTVQELKKMMDEKAEFQLIDVREPHEADICEIGGELIPQGDIPSNVDKISRDKKVVIHCRSGARSGNMVQWLEKNHGFTNLYNLKGGILAWADQIDPSVQKY